MLYRNKFGYTAVCREPFLPAHLKSQFGQKREVGAYHENFVKLQTTPIIFKE